MKLQMNNIQMFDYKDDIVVVKFFRNEPTNVEYIKYLAYLSKKMEQNKNLKVIIDIRSMPHLSYNLRMLQNDWEEQHQQLIRSKRLSRIYVIDNLLSKILLEDIFETIDPDSDFEFAADFMEALSIAFKDKGRLSTRYYERVLMREYLN